MNNKDKFANYKAKVNDVIQNMIYELFKKQPENYIDWMIEYLEVRRAKHHVKATQSLQITYHISSEEENQDDVDEMENTIKKEQQFRTSVSAEVYGLYNKKEDFKPRVIPKSQDLRERIENKLNGVFMFQALDQNERNIIIDAMEEKHFNPGDWIINQGDDGNELYVVAQGQLDCFRRFSKDQEPKLIKQYQSGDMFGELALLYNAPRAASIQSNTESVLFALDRSTFNAIVKEATVKRREHYEDVLSKVEILKSIDSYEKTQICDGLKEQHFKAQDYIIKEGEEGNKFYIVVKGTLIALKQNEEVLRYQSGDYFGELALLNQVPRQATIQAETDSIVVYLDYQAFIRLIGPIENILTRNAENYKKFVN
ncbi:unnamed protein product [Paramecium pentaurelia]|uniref:cAMP-dependent protein kinase regulatory subunit n=1 Tax=Paramecium pentaurelia TaxID=43138 RepID=A0A8S1VXQ0_9CILI|nr:unnamed protein product [Paramecium pentaurelia]